MPYSIVIIYAILTPVSQSKQIKVHLIQLKQNALMILSEVQHLQRNEEHKEVCKQQQQQDRQQAEERLRVLQEFHI
jgi:hypothetical protein